MPPFETLVPQLVDELARTLGGIDAAEVEALRAAIRAARRVYVAGKGRSGLQMRAFAMRLMHAGLAAHVVDDVTTPAIGAGDLLILGSGSGRTASLVQYAARANAAGAQVALITAAATTPPAGEHADAIVRLVAPTPKLGAASQGQSVLPMGSLFEQALGLLLDLVIVQLMADLDLTAEEMFTRHANLE